MPDRILIAYASRSGSTAEVAAAIADVLRDATDSSVHGVDVADVAQVRDLGPYRGVVIGSAVRMGRLLSPAVQFAQNRRADLAGKTAAYFSVSATMKEDTPENRKLAADILQPQCQIREPVSLGLFAGSIDPQRLPIPWRWMVKSAKEGIMAPGDFRRWDEIRAWAESLIPLLAHNR